MRLKELLTPRFLRSLIRKETNNPFSLKTYIIQKVLGINRKAYWPVHFTSTVVNPENIFVGVDGAPGLSKGCYIQGIGKIYFGDYIIIGPNVGIISANHDVYDLRAHNSGEVRIGNYCWIGMNSVIMPGVELGNHTIVAAGSVVTKSFPEGYVVIGGTPATIIEHLETQKCIEYEYKDKFYGYIPEQKFERFRKRYLNV